MTPKQLEKLQPLLTLTGRKLGWVIDHEEALRKLFPEEWTHVLDLNPLQILFNLKLLDLNWSTTDDAARMMTALTQAGFCYRNEGQVKRKNFPVLYRD